MSRSSRRAADKQTMVDLFGGKCQRCSYSKCLRALQFHHVDSSEKDLWSGARKGSASMTEVNHYPERFELLCANCHFEEHENDHNKRYTRECVQCHASFVASPSKEREGKDRYCSKACYQVHRVGLSSDPARIRKRLERKIRVEGNCWIWTGYKDKDHKSPIASYTWPDGKHTYCSVRSLTLLVYLDIPLKKTRSTRMSCGRSDCVNPDHIKVYDLC